MKSRVFRAVWLTALAVLLVTVTVITVLVLPALGRSLFEKEILLSLVWLIAGGIVLSAAAAALFAKWVADPVKKLDPDRPQAEENAYKELRPLVRRCREQNRSVRKLTEELENARHEFAAITGNMSEGFLLLDRRLNILTKNPAAERLLPTPEKGGADNLNTNGCPEEIIHAASKALAGQRTALTYRARGRAYYIVTSPVTAEGQITGVIVIALDATEQEERETLRREFSANVSHELKTPLTSISGFAELLQNGMVPPERVGEFAGDIYKESVRLIHLVDDILALSQMDEGAPAAKAERVELREEAEAVLRSLTDTAAQQNVTLSLEGGDAAASGIRPVLHEMIFNLCENAIKYNRPGGRVTVTTAEEERGSRLTVEDTGIGIPIEYQDRIFERFFRVDKSRSRAVGGTGLGLSIVKHAAQMHKAQLEVHSEPEHGTRITVIFPRTAE